MREKIEKDSWLQEMPRQRQQYWFRGFKKQLLRSGAYFQKRWREKLDNFLDNGIIVSTHSMKDFRVV